MVSLTLSVSSALLVLSALTGISSAAPAPAPVPEPAPEPAPENTAALQYVRVDFIGAANSRYTRYVPLNRQTYYTNNPLSISHVQLIGAGGPCTFYGIDNLQLTVASSARGVVDVGPPQTITRAVCGPY